MTSFISCVCSSVGYCPLLKRTMSKIMWDICSGRCPPGRSCTPEIIAGYRAYWAFSPIDAPTIPPTPPDDPPRLVNVSDSMVRPGQCTYLGEPTGEVRSCTSCWGNVRVKLFTCALHVACTPTKHIKDLKCCMSCSDYIAKTETG